MEANTAKSKSLHWWYRTLQFGVWGICWMGVESVSYTDLGTTTVVAKWPWNVIMDMIVPNLDYTPRILFGNFDNLMSLYVYSVYCGSIVDEIMFLHVLQQGINWCQFAHAFPDWDTPAWNTTRYYLVFSRSKFPRQWALTIDLHYLETIHYIRNHYHEVKMIGVFIQYIDSILYPWHYGMKLIVWLYDRVIRYSPEYQWPPYRSRNPCNYDYSCYIYQYRN